MKIRCFGDWTRALMAGLLAAVLLAATAGTALPPAKAESGDDEAEPFMSGETRKEILLENAKWSLPEDLSKEDVQVGQMDAFWIRHKDGSAAKVLLYLHGGAYIASVGKHHERMAANYAAYGDVDVLTVDYRTAPAKPYPAALDDARAAYAYLLEEGYAPEEIILAGSSAGGGLALSLALYLRDHDMMMPGAIITMSAWTDLSRFPRLAAPYVGESDPQDPYISPAYGAYQGFPAMLLQVGEEPVTDDSYAVYDKAMAEGVDVTLTRYDGMPHVFQNLSLEREAVAQAWTEVGAFLQGLDTD